MLVCVLQFWLPAQVPHLLDITLVSHSLPLVQYTTDHCSTLMFATTLLAPIAAGLLTTLEIDDELDKVLALLGFLGA